MSLSAPLDLSEAAMAWPRQDPPPPETLRVIPLGGVGEFGKNCLALEYGEDMLLIDCGQKFPENEMFGVDLVIPDFAYVTAHADRLRALILTHGHEDHIGAVPFLLRQLPRRRLPIFGSRLTLALVAEKLSEMDLQDAAEWFQVEPGSVHSIGEFRVEFLSVTHSIPQSLALAIHLPIGVVVHTGDYKFNPQPPADEHGLETLARYTDPPDILLLLGDSTNVDREGYSPAESSVREGLGSVMADADRAIILATFSSNLHRVQTALDLTEALSRRIAVCGYSLERNFEIATRLGLLNYRNDWIYPLHDLVKLTPSQRLILTTGTQGEPLSALSRLALNSFKGYKVQSGDLVILSSRIIPGNERAIYHMINHFYRHGASVITERDARVHASGHAYRDELGQLLELTRPRYFMPIHGELRQLVRHRDLARSLGLPDDRIFILENGKQLEVGRRGAVRMETQWADQVLVDGKMIDRVDEIVLRDRRHLSADGMLTVILVIDQASHRIIAGPDIVSRGFIVVDENQSLMEACKDLVVQTFEDCDKESREEWEVVKAAVRKALRKFLRDETDRYPVILPVVVEI